MNPEAFLQNSQFLELLTHNIHTISSEENDMHFNHFTVIN